MAKGKQKEAEADIQSSSAQHSSCASQTSDQTSIYTTTIDAVAEQSKVMKPKIQDFKGSDDKINVENWLKRFEQIASYFQWNDDQKVLFVGNYLQDDALNWYLENCESDSWFEIKQKLIARFGVPTVEPIVEFFYMRYDTNVGIKEYFEKKRRLGALANLTESQIIPMLIQGLHPKMITHFTAVKPKTYAEFYSIAQTAEANFKRFEGAKPTRNAIQNQKPIVNKENVKQMVKRKPPQPCKICEKLGFRNRYHWSSDCFNKNKANMQVSKSTNAKEVNCVENASAADGFDEINQINLN